MDSELRGIGERIRSRMPPGMTQGQLAERTQMKPDALSRALNGQRGIAMVELVRFADVLGVETHWLLTGQRDPHRVEVAARHRYDAQRRVRENPGEDSDRSILDRVRQVYRAAFPDGPRSDNPLPADAAGVRAAIGADFVRTFAETIESRLGVDVLRIPDLTTDYSMTVGAQPVIVLAAGVAWTRSNWSLGHELGHLVLGHHDDSNARVEDQENAADAFAAELLLPADEVRSFASSSPTPRDLADFVWRTGISPAALENRLRYLHLGLPRKADEALQLSGPKLVLQMKVATREEIAARRQGASDRRASVGLVAALTEQVEASAADPSLLEWLGVSLEDVEYQEIDEEAAAAAYRRELDDRPSASEVLRMLG